MEKIINPDPSEWNRILERPQLKNEELLRICKDIFSEIRKHGDQAVAKYTWFFDKAKTDRLEVSENEFAEAEKAVDTELKEAIQIARQNIEDFHKLQLSVPERYNHPGGFSCWQEIRSIEKVGLYIPGGSAPLFSTVLMLAVPARLAGCEEIVLCSPPGQDGKVNPVILWTARLCGVNRVFKVGGVQAIGALTLGTKTIPRVYKIFGPGNQYVTAAKQLAANYGVSIDMPAGPSEVMVIADQTAKAAFVASDLLSQAEHGPDSQVILLTTDPALPEKVEREMQRQMADLPRKGIILRALESSRAVVLQDMDRCIALANVYAPEHLILCVEENARLAARIKNAGSVFLGNYSPESAGDYASGTNHTLPTNGNARAYSGVNMDAFVKKITFQEISRKGLEKLGPVIEKMAEYEQLEAHRRAVEIRLALDKE